MASRRFERRLIIEKEEGESGIYTTLKGVINDWQCVSIFLGKSLPVVKVADEGLRTRRELLGTFDACIVCEVADQAPWAMVRVVFGTLNARTIVADQAERAI